MLRVFAFREVNVMEKIRKAYEDYAAAQTKESYQQLLLALSELEQSGETIPVPVEMNCSSRLNYGMVKTTDGYYYVICTSDDELAKCREKTSADIKLEKLLIEAVENPRACGICINPYSSCPCFIPEEYIKKIFFDK